MIALAVAVLASSLFSLTIKFAEQRAHHLKTVGAVNYLLGATAYTIASVGHGWPGLTTVLAGLLGGVAISTAFLLLTRLMRLKGISVVAGIIRLSVVFPIFFSILLWGERPNWIQSVGVGLAIVSLPLFGMDRRQEGRVRIDPRVLLIGVLLLCVNGGFMLSIRLFDQIGTHSEHIQFFAVMFGVATAIAAGAWLLDRQGSSPRDLVPGAWLGLCNMGSGYMLLRALQTLPGVIVFPLSASLGLMLTVLAATWLWGERIGRPSAVGLTISLAAAVCMNIS